jgi:hypothetical protein
LDQSNYLPNQKQGTVNKYDLTVFIRPFHGLSRALNAVVVFKVPAVFHLIHDGPDLIQDSNAGSHTKHLHQSLECDPKNGVWVEILILKKFVCKTCKQAKLCYTILHKTMQGAKRKA